MRRYDEVEGKALSERLKLVRAATKEYTSAAVLKKLAQARPALPWAPCARC